MSVSATTIIQFTTAPAGTGKSYLRCARFIADELLPETELRHISNFPYDPATMAAFVADKHNLNYEETVSRLELIPGDEMSRWMTGDTGPWDYFRDKSINGCHIAIDEIHNFCGSASPLKVRKLWMQWLGEIRHMGATIEFISQNPEKVAREIKNEAAIHRILTSSDDVTDPWFSIPLGDWYELRAMILGSYMACVYETFARPNLRGKLEIDKSKTRRFWLLPEYFALYNSYSQPHAGGVAASGPPKRQFERRTRLGLVWWFVRRHFFALGSRLWIPCVLLFLIMGGGKHIMLYLINTFAQAGKRNMPSADEVKEASGQNEKPKKSPAPAPQVRQVKADISAPVGPPSSSQIDEHTAIVILRQQNEINRLRGGSMSPAFEVPTTQPAIQATPVPIVVFSLLFSGSAVTRTGEVFRVGDVVHEETKLEEIDVVNARVRLGTRWVRLGAQWMPDGAKAAEPGAPDDSPASQTNNRADKPDGQPSKARDPQRPGRPVVSHPPKAGG